MELATTWQLDRRFDPTMPAEVREGLQCRWREAVQRARGWVAPGAGSRGQESQRHGA